MSDIVERLTDRTLAVQWLNEVGPGKIMREAADEIMALRTKAGNWEKVFGRLGTPETNNMTEQEAFEEWAIANWPFAADEDAASIWHAALAWMRSQGEPVGAVRDNPDDNGNRHAWGELYDETLPLGAPLYAALKSGECT